MSFLVRSGNVTSGDIGNAAVVSGSIGSGQIGSGHLASGLIAGLQSGGAGLVSGQVTSGFIGDNAVVSGSIASGQISDLHFASGANINEANWLAFSGLIAGELISGGKAVTIQSGTGLVFRTGFNPLSGILVYGLVPDIAASGQPVKVYTQGPVFMGAISGLISGKVGAPFAYTGNGIVGIGGPTVIGTVFSGSIVNLTIPFILSGTITGTLIASGAIQQGQLSTLPAAVTPANIASGVIVDTAFQLQAGGASGAFNFGGPFLQTSQAISGGRAVSFDTAVPTVHFAQIRIAQAGIPATMPAFGIVIDNVVSGDIVNAHTHGYVPAPQLSGLLSGNNGKPIFVNTSGDLSITQPTNSGALVQALGTAVHDTLFGELFGIELVSQPWSGSISYLQLGSGAVLSGNIGLGQIASGHLASGFLGGAATAGTTLTQFKTTETISGGRCVTVVGSGLIAISHPAQTGSGLACIGVVFDNVLSGQFANVVVAGVGPDVPAIEGAGGITAPGRDPVYVGTSGLLSLRPGSGATIVEIGTFTNFSGGTVINVVPQTSGGFGAYRLGSGAVQSGNIASGTIGHFMISSGGVEGTGLSGIPSNIASGSIGANDLRQSIITHGHLDVGAGSPFTNTMAYGVAIGPGNLTAGQAQMSGGAVAFISLPGVAGQLTVVPAERNSGLRLPAIGVMASGAASGQDVVVVTQGFVPSNFFIASGYIGQMLYVGSGGFIVTQSGGLGATFSGAGLVSGGSVQRIGVVVSGGMFVHVDMNITSGFNSTPAGVF